MSPNPTFLRNQEILTAVLAFNAAFALKSSKAKTKEITMKTPTLVLKLTNADFVGKHSQVSLANFCMKAVLT